jgi:hypothetical protein
MTIFKKLFQVANNVTDFKSKSGQLNLQLEYIIFFIAATFIFSFNAHFLWIVYDIVAIGLMVYFIRDKFSLGLGITQWGLIFLTVCYFVIISLTSEMPLYSLLSAWDSLKHIPICLLLLRVGLFMYNQEKITFFNDLYYLIFFSFIIQLIFVAIQVYYDVKFDDVAGTFGDGATHSLAYFSVLFVCLVIVLNKGLWLTLFSIFGACWLNLNGENVGFFVLLPLAIIWIYINKRFKVINLSLIIVVSSLVVLMLEKPIYNNTPFSQVISSRVTDFISGHYNPGTPGRSQALISGFEVGGWFGAGPGSYSNIYLMQGYKYDKESDVSQIAISESSHLLAEAGIVGMVLIIFLYQSLIWLYFKRWRNKVFSLFYFTACFFYGSLLMTEPQIFMLLLTMLVLKYSEFSYAKTT